MHHAKGPRGCDPRPSQNLPALDDRVGASCKTKSPEIQRASGGTEQLVRYDAACRALAEARSVDEVKDIRDQAVAMAAYAKQAKNKDLEADAVEIRMRATRRLDQLSQAQKETVGLNQGGRPTKTGFSDNPVLPTLAMQGIDKNLAHQARLLGALSDEKFETVITDARDKVARAVGTRLAVTPEQIERYRLPTVPAKDTDNRAFSGDTCQTEALPPDVLTDILRTAIEQRTDRRAFERVLRQERVARRNLLRQIPTSFARHAP